MPLPPCVYTLTTEGQAIGSCLAQLSSIIHFFRKVICTWIKLLVFLNYNQFIYFLCYFNIRLIKQKVIKHNVWFLDISSEFDKELNFFLYSRRTQRTKRCVIILFIMILIFFISWAPLHYVNISMAAQNLIQVKLQKITYSLLKLCRD